MKITIKRAMRARGDSPPSFIAYADKRVRHTEFVSLDERFDDLMERYGIDDERKARITGYLTRAKAIEKAIFDRIGEF